MQKGSPSPGTTKDAPEKNHHLKTAVSVAITEASATVPGQNQEEDPDSALAVRKRKYDTRWKQQKNLAVRQNFTLINILILYLVIGIIFMCFAIICLLYARAYPNILIEDYTHCLSARLNNSNFTTPTPSQNETMSGECFPSERSRDGVHPLNISKSISCTCEVKIIVDNSPLWKSSNLILYFELSKFHQNIRRYRKDVDWDQLAGHALANGKAAFTKCKYPYFNATNNKYIFPCGKVANSYFSDKFQLLDGSGKKLTLKQEGISWESDKHRFVNPKGLDNLPEIHSKFDLPRDWHDGLVHDFLKEHHHDYGHAIENEHFIVWMRTAALNNFRKKYAYLPALDIPGEYTMLIQYRYEVKSYKGTKKFIIAADYNDRPKDYFFFYIYLFVSVYCLVVGPLLLLINWILKTIDKRKSHSQKSGSSSDPTNTTTDTEVESGRSSALQMTSTDGPQVTSSEHPSTNGSIKSFFGFGR